MNTEGFSGLSSNYFSCPRCNRSCECVFDCGPEKYLMETEIDTTKQTALVSIYEYDRGRKGKEVYNKKLPMNGDKVPVPDDFMPCLNPRNHCNCY